MTTAVYSPKNLDGDDRGNDVSAYIGISAVLLLMVGLFVGLGAMSIYTQIIVNRNVAPLQAPVQPASENLPPWDFAPPFPDCRTTGACPLVDVLTRNEDFAAFNRHLELAARIHGGGYAYDDNRGGVYTVRLPRDAADELLALHRRGVEKIWSPVSIKVSPGYQQWAERWSQELPSARASAAAAEPATTLRVRVWPQRGRYAGPIFLAFALLFGGLAAYATYEFIRGRLVGATADTPTT